MTGLRIALAVAAALLLALLVWAGMGSATPYEAGGIDGDLFQQLTGPIMMLPTGLFITIDRFAALAAIAVIIIFAERSFGWGTLWAVPLVVFGALWAAVWLALRLPSLARRLTFPDRDPG
jgi:hypothetical protein